MEEKTFKSVPTLETKRLIIRPICLNDIDFMFCHMTSKDVRKLFNKSWPDNLGGVEKFVKECIEKNEKDQAAEWIIVLRNEKKPIGRIWFCGLLTWCNAVNVGYSLDYDFWGKGITSEALKRVVEFGFDEINLRRIEAYHDSDNLISGKVMLKCGFIFEGTLRERSSF